MRNNVLLSLLFLGLLAGCGKKDENPQAAASQPQTVVAPVVAAPDEHLAKGEHVYKGTCAMCHGTGAGGAPLFKSKEEWAPRIAQGKEVLYGHALKGFSGAKGVMPAKGGNTSLPDEDVTAGVDYMVSQAK